VTVSVNDMTIDSPAWEQAIRGWQQEVDVGAWRATVTEEEVQAALQEYEEREEAAWVERRREHNEEVLWGLLDTLQYIVNGRPGLWRGVIEPWRVRLMVIEAVDAAHALCDLHPPRGLTGAPMRSEGP
jgi:hypothetical protein